MYCEQCGAKVIQKETNKGTYSRLPTYFRETDGKELTNTHYVCPRKRWWNNHAEYWINNY